MIEKFQEYMINGNDLLSNKNERKKSFIIKKINTDELPRYVDEGWERSKEYKDPKKVGVQKDKSAEEMFINRIWILLANMGFPLLNKQVLEISFDFQDPNKTGTIDVLGVDDETILAFRCKASETLQNYTESTEINDYCIQLSGLRKRISKYYPDRKSRFIFATSNYIMKKTDLTKLEEAGISYFSEVTVNYYSELVKHLGSSARYQLLGNVFANQDIRNMENRIPAIQGKMGGYTYYSFSIEPEKLLKIGYVLHRNEANSNMMPTYQRIIKKSRLQGVRSFVNNGGYFPNSIIISIDTGGKGLKFEQSPTKVENAISKLGVLFLPKKYRSAYIIDGQHRLYGYSDSKYASTNTIPVVAFVDLDRNEQIKLFMDINENQKAVPKSLRVTLNADMLWDSKDLNEQRQALRSKIAQMLGEESTSPLFNRIVIGENESTPTRCITVEAIQVALKRCEFFDSYGKRNELVKEGTFDCKNNQKTCDLFYPFIEKCLEYIKESCLEEWDKGDQNSGMITMNRGIQAIIRVLNDIIDFLEEKNMIDVKNQDIEDYFNLIKHYLKPLVDYLNDMDDEERKDLRGYFGGGADTRFWRAYQRAIAQKRQDFNPVGLKEYWADQDQSHNEETQTMSLEIKRKVKDIISSKLESEFGESWLEKGLPKTIYTKAKSAAIKEAYERPDDAEYDEEVAAWNSVSLSDCKQIILNGKNWSLFFEESFTRPEEKNISGGKDAKSLWMDKINTIENKLINPKYSVSTEEFIFVKNIYDWIMNVIVF